MNGLITITAQLEEMMKDRALSDKENDFINLRSQINNIFTELRDKHHVCFLYAILHKGIINPKELEVSGGSCATNEMIDVIVAQIKEENLQYDKKGE